MHLPGTYFGSEPNKQQQSHDDKATEEHGAQPSQFHADRVRGVIVRRDGLNVNGHCGVQSVWHNDQELRNKL
jgi:hypothetical protein